MERDQMKFAVFSKYVPVRTSILRYTSMYQYVLVLDYTYAVLKFDLVTLYPMHRRCITLISSLLTLSGLVRKPLALDFLKVRTGMYWYIPVCTNW